LDPDDPHSKNLDEILSMNVCAENGQGLKATKKVKFFLTHSATQLDPLRYPQSVSDPESTGPQKRMKNFNYKELAVLRRVGASLRAWKPFKGA
jgi:hypothetical protein